MVANSEKESGFDVVNRSLHRVDGKALVNGKPVFAGDFDYPDGLVAGVLESPKAHAEITDIDTSGGRGGRSSIRYTPRERTKSPAHDGRSGLPGTIALRCLRIRQEG